MILGAAPAMFLEALRRRDAALLALALDLCVPPLALLVLLVLAVLAASAALFALTAVALPLWLAAVALALLASCVLACWGRYGRHVVSLADLAFAPFYALSKLPLYLAFLARRQAEWVRSRRDGD